VDLGNLPINDPLWGLNVTRRETALNEASDKSSPAWILDYAQFLYQTGSYAESRPYASQLIRRRAELDDPYLPIRAWTLLCLAEFSLGRIREGKDHFDQFQDSYRDSEDPFIEAMIELVRGDYLLAGTTGEVDSHARAVECLQISSELFKRCGEIDLSVLSSTDLAMSLAATGRYLQAVKEIELAMDLAREHDAYFFTGRLLFAGATAATDQGYRKGVESALRRAIDWCDFVGDHWGKIQTIYALGRLLAYQMPMRDIAAASLPEKYFLEAYQGAEQSGAMGLASHVTASLAWTYQKSGDKDRFQQLLDRESKRVGGYKAHFDGMFENSVDVVKAISVRTASRLHDGIANHPDAFFIFDSIREAQYGAIDFINFYRNDAGAKMLGLGEGTVFMYSETKEDSRLMGLADPLIAAVEHRIPFKDNHRFTDGDDSFWFSRQIVPSEDGAILIVRDVTAEQRIETALRTAAQSAERSDRAKSEFLANMSHEIRTPINGVLGLARLLDDTHLDSTQRAYLKDIIGSGDILIRVIGNVLDLSKMESHSMPLDVRPTVVEEVVVGTVRLFQGQAREKGLVLSTKIDASTPKVILADGPRIRQIVANLVGNAVKFTKHGSVSLVVTGKDGTISIEVADTGIGIPPDRLEAVFDRFQQATPESRLLGGTGLGLTISRGIVELMGGSVSVTSEVGKGSSFLVQIPVVETTIDIASQQSVRKVSFTGLRVLLVDDNRVNNMVSTFALERLGCLVMVAGNGVEALESWEKNPCDVVLMDIRMPVLDGLEATREIRRREASLGSRTPVVALTAGALLEERSECFDAGMDDYISKPFTDDVLRDVLSRWLPSVRH